VNIDKDRIMDLNIIIKNQGSDNAILEIQTTSDDDNI
jgi:hypothetical protein